MSDQPSVPTGFTAPSIEELGPLFPSYQIEGFIAQGGMGAVYRATQRSLERPVAIKILPREFGADPNFRASFEAEAKAMARLNHPNLIGVFDFGDIDGMLFIIMEFVQGKALYYSVHNKIIDPLIAFEIVSTICRGLAHAHDSGIIHRDIKPANILLDLDATPKIGDFGLARPLDHDRSEHVAFGTPGYTAPEVCHHTHPIDQRSDIFSVGALLYEMLSGQAPQPDSTEMTIGKDSRIDAILKKATHADPNQRYHNARDFADALDELAPKLSTPQFAAPTTNSPSPRLTTPSLTSPKKSSLLPLFLVLLLLASGAFFAYFTLIKDKKDQEAPATTPSETEEQSPKDASSSKPFKPGALTEKPDQNPEPVPKDSPDPAIPEENLVQETPIQALRRLRPALSKGERTEFPPKTQKFGNSAYFLAKRKVTWREANRIAQSFGANLAILPNPETLEWVTQNFSSPSAIWTGASDSGTEKKWHWQDGSTLDPKLWASGEPNNLSSSSPYGEDFAALRPKAGKLADLPGATQLPFLMEWKLDGSKAALLSAELARTSSALKAKRSPVFPTGTYNLGGSRFLLIHKTLTWKEASDFAIAAGAHLAVPSNPQEASFALDLLENVLPPNQSCWIGGRRSTEQNEIWETVTGETFAFLEWLPGQPDNFGEGEDFLVLCKMGQALGANDENGINSKVNFFLIEWSHPSLRNFSQNTENLREPTKLEKTVFDLRERIVRQHQREFRRFRRKYEKLLTDFSKSAISETLDSPGDLNADEQDALIAKLKNLKDTYGLPEQAPPNSSEAVQELFAQTRTDALRLWKPYEKDFRKALSDYLRVLDDEARRAFRRGDQILAKTLKTEATQTLENSTRLHQILDGQKVPLALEDQ